MMQACLENNVPNFKVSESPDLNSLDYKTEEIQAASFQFGVAQTVDFINS